MPKMIDADELLVEIDKYKRTHSTNEISGTWNNALEAVKLSVRLLARQPSPASGDGTEPTLSQMIEGYYKEYLHPGTGRGIGSIGESAYVWRILKRIATDLERKPDTARLRDWIEKGWDAAINGNYDSANVRLAEIMLNLIDGRE